MPFDDALRIIISALRCVWMMRNASKRWSFAGLGCRSWPGAVFYDALCIMLMRHASLHLAICDCSMPSDVASRLILFKKVMMRLAI